MKHQYFGDRRDLFKYDLLLEILSNVQKVTQLTFVPMLTPDDGGTHGQITQYERGGYRAEVYDFLQDRLKAGKRSLHELRPFFADRPFAFTMHAEGFFATDRTTYFTAIPDHALQSAVVFFDPDNGLEPGAGAKKEHLSYEELASVLRRAKLDTLAVVFQYFPRIKRDVFLETIATRIRNAVPGKFVFAVHDADLAFLLVATKAHLPSLLAWLPAYARQRGLQVWPRSVASIQTFQLERAHFGYGSNMCDPWLRRHAPSALAKGAATLGGWRLTFDKESKDQSAKADITESAAHTVHGVLFDIDATDMPELNQKEGGYDPHPITVTQGSTDVLAWTYRASSTGTMLRPWHWYVALMVAGAKHHKLPSGYVASLAATPTQTDTDQVRIDEAQRCIAELGQQG